MQRRNYPDPGGGVGLGGQNRTCRDQEQRGAEGIVLFVWSMEEGHVVEEEASSPGSSC